MSWHLTPDIAVYGIRAGRPLPSHRLPFCRWRRHLRKAPRRPRSCRRSSAGETGGGMRLKGHSLQQDSRMVHREPPCFCLITYRLRQTRSAGAHVAHVTLMGTNKGHSSAPVFSHYQRPWLPEQIPLGSKSEFHNLKCGTSLITSSRCWPFARHLPQDRASSVTVEQG